MHRELHLSFGLGDSVFGAKRASLIAEVDLCYFAANCKSFKNPNLWALRNHALSTRKTAHCLPPQLSARWWPCSLCPRLRDHLCCNLRCQPRNVKAAEQLSSFCPIHRAAALLCLVRGTSCLGNRRLGQDREQDVGIRTVSFVQYCPPAFGLRDCRLHCTRTRRKPSLIGTKG